MCLPDANEFDDLIIHHMCPPPIHFIIKCFKSSLPKVDSILNKSIGAGFWAVVMNWQNGNVEEM